MAKKNEYIVLVGPWDSFDALEVCASKKDAYECAKDLASSEADARVYEVKQIATAYIPEPTAQIEEED